MKDKWYLCLVIDAGGSSRPRHLVIGLVVEGPHAGRDECRRPAQLPGNDPQPPPPPPPPPNPEKLESSRRLRVLGKKYIKRLLTVNTMYYMKPQNPI